jgi:hypothetical protein
MLQPIRPVRVTGDEQGYRDSKRAQKHGLLNHSLCEGYKGLSNPRTPPVPRVSKRPRQGLAIPWDPRAARVLDVEYPLKIRPARTWSLWWWCIARGLRSPLHCVVGPKPGLGGACVGVGAVAVFFVVLICKRTEPTRKITTIAQTEPTPTIAKTWGGVRWGRRGSGCPCWPGTLYSRGRRDVRRACRSVSLCTHRYISLCMSLSRNRAWGHTLG